MKTLRIKFESEGKTITKIAILTNDLSDISESKKNEASYVNEYEEDRFWSIYFECEEKDYEAEFELEDGEKTLNPIQVVTWNKDGIIINVKPAIVKVK